MTTQSLSAISQNKLFDAGFVQRREWMLYKIRSDQYPFNLSIYFETNSFNQQLFQEVIDLMVKRHEILRTTLELVDNDLKQVIHSPDTFPVNFAYFDIKSLSDVEKADFYNEKIASDLGTPFNFETGPLFRILVFEITDSYFIAHFVFHHVISDRHSTELFTTDIIELYKMVRGKQARKLPDDNIQYSEYTFFENELLETPKGNEYRKYWEKTLEDGIPRLSIINNDRWDEHNQVYIKKVNEVKQKIYQLPYFDERFIASVIRRYQVEDAGEVIYIYDKNVFGKIKAYEEEGKNGLLSLFIGGLLLAFNKLSGQTAFAFEIPASRRATGNFNDTMGWLTSGGPCYFDISRNLTSAELLDYIDQQLYSLSINCVYPCEVIAYDSMLPLGSRMPVFLTLSYLNNEQKSKESGIIFKRSSGSGTYQDIAFFFTFFKNSVTLNITYNNMLFSDEQVELLLNEHIIALEDILNK